MPTGYVDRTGRPMKKEEWDRKRQEPSYVVVRQFDNERTKVILQWVGCVPNIQNLYGADYYPLYRMDIWNYNDAGQRVKDPLSGKTFSLEAKAIQAYDEFVSQYSDSFVDAAGELIEIGNTLKPALPPDPNRPITTPDELGGEAW